MIYIVEPDANDFGWDREGGPAPLAGRVQRRQFAARKRGPDRGHATAAQELTVVRGGEVARVVHVAVIQDHRDLLAHRAHARKLHASSIAGMQSKPGYDMLESHVAVMIKSSMRCVTPS